MAVRFDAIGDHIVRTANLPGYPFTICFWFYLSVDRNAYSALTWIHSSGTTRHNLFLSSNGTQLGLWNGSIETNGSNLTVGTWAHLAHVANGIGTAGNHLAYLNGLLDVSQAGNNGAYNTMRMGSDGVDLINGRMAAIKIYGATLTAAEIAAEMCQYLPVRTANLNGFYPLFTVGDDEIDFSGNANNWTVGGTLATEDGPPIPWKASPRQRIVTSGGGGGGTETASVSPVAAAWSVPAVAATIRVTASISPASATWSAPAVSPSTKVAADVAPVSAAWSASTVSGVAVLVATVSPATAAWSAQSVSPTIRAAASAAPAAATWSVPAVAAQATVIAAVSPAAVAWSVPATAGRAVLTATVSPVSAAWSVQSPAPTIHAAASVAPAAASWSSPAVAAESFVEAEVSPAAAAWSAVAPAATIRITAAVSPAAATWSAPSVAGSATAGPTVTSANVNAAGTMLAIHFEELMQGYEGFTLNASGGPVTLTYAGFGGPDNPILYTLSRTISIGETLTLDYAPGDVAEYGFGSPGESLDAFSDFPVTNNSTIGVGSVSPVSATWGVPAVSGQTEAVAAAVVSPATATWSVSSVEGRARITALVTPAAVQWSAVAPQATIRARGTLIPAAAAWSVISPAPTIRARAAVSPRAAHWSAPALAGQTDLIPPEYGHVEISDAARWDVAATDSRRWRCEVSDTGDPSG